LRRRLAELEAYGMANQKVSRYQLEDGEYAVRKAKSELMIKVRECEVLTAENYTLK
jgi:DNA-binding HxlR family transcriptional regulator